MNAAATHIFRFPIRVYWEDTDAGGIVFYANYLKFMERARTEWLRSLGVEQHALKERTGGMFVVTETQLKYLSPARLDDVLHVSAEIIEKGRANLKIKQEISLYPATNLPSLLSNEEQLNSLSATASHTHGMHKAVCEGTICIAWVDSASLKPGRIPPDVLEALR
jgi:acyl-CoA thioester hydrolase